MKASRIISYAIASAVFMLLATNLPAQARDACSDHAREGFRCVGAINQSNCPPGESTGDYTCSEGQMCCKSGNFGKDKPEAVTVNVGPKNGAGDMYGFFTAVLGKLQSLVGYLALLFLVIGAILYILASFNEGFKKAANTCISGAIIGLVIAVAAPSLLLEIKKIAFNGGAIPSDPSQLPGVRDIVIRALSILLSIVGSLAIIGLVVSGIMMVTSYGNKNMTDKAKDALKFSIIGIVVAAASLVLVRQIVTLIAS